MKICSVILARGGSKGIPNKNIVNLNGHPLVSYVIKTSLESNINETWVSTDSKEIAKISEEYGAKVLIRPFNISGDKDKSELALLHFLENIKCDVLVFIQPTSPLLKAKYINDGIYKLLSNKELSSVFSVFEEHWLPRWGTDRLPIDWSIDNRPMRQDMPTRYVENGAFYISYAKDILQNQLRYNLPLDYVVMSQLDSLGIDTYDDLDLISNIMKFYK